MRKHFFKGLHALALLLGVSAAIHLAIVFVLAVAKHDVQMINPMYFFGLDKVFQTLTGSVWAVILGWAGLIAAFWIFYLLLHMDKMPLVLRRRQIREEQELNP